MRVNQYGRYASVWRLCTVASWDGRYDGARARRLRGAAAKRSLRVTVDALEIGKGYDGPLKKNAACFAMSYPANTITRVTVTLK